MSTGYSAEDAVMNGRSTLFGAAMWMAILSFALTVLLGWVPVVGPFIGPAIGGYVGGRRAGSAGRAVAAAVLPAVLLFLLITLFGAAAGMLGGVPLLGLVAVAIAGMASFAALAGGGVMIAAALVGGAVRASESV